MSDLPDHVRRNRALWDDWAPQYVASGEEGWAAVEPRWGIWGVPESQLNILPGSLAGKDAIELGCGTAYVSAWLARRGARVVGIDNSEAQLATARRLQEQHGLHFPLLHGSAEAVPYPDQSFDFAISEYGACLWADPQRWVPEAARLLRPGGQLVFLTNSFLLMLCMPAEEGIAATDRLLRAAFGMYGVEWPNDPAARAKVAASSALWDRAPLLQPRDRLPVVAELEEDLLGVLPDLGHRPLRRPAVDGEVDGRGHTRDLCPVGLRHVDEGAGGDRLRVADDVLGRLHGRPPHAGAVEDRAPLGERAGGEDLVEQADQLGAVFPP